MLNVTSTTQAASAAPSAEQQKLRKACQDLEAAFLRHLLRKMRDSVPSDGLIERSQAQQTYQEMLDGALADSISRQGSLGLGEMLYRQLLPTLPGAVTAAGTGPAAGEMSDSTSARAEGVVDAAEAAWQLKARK